ncbi:putative ribonuclease H domain-containing protein [Arabidopsis thaliana]
MSDSIAEKINHILTLLQHKTITDFQKLLPYWLLWRIWKVRNNVVFNNFRESPTNTALRSQAETRDWLNATQSQRRENVRIGTSTTSNTAWQPPPITHLKCNFDAGFNVQSLNATAGWIIRNHEGKPQHWGSLKLDHTSTPLEAETKALLAALQQTWVRGYKQVVMEGDCQTLINLANGSTSHSSIANLLEDIHFWASKFSSIHFSFVRRRGNKLAHDLAKFGCISTCFYSDIGTLPF